MNFIQKPDLSWKREKVLLVDRTEFEIKQQAGSTKFQGPSPV